jgi:hypothetical protein
VEYPSFDGGTEQGDFWKCRQTREVHETKHLHVPGELSEASDELGKRYYSLEQGHGVPAEATNGGPHRVLDSQSKHR